MKIVELYSENVKRLKAVTIKPEGNTVLLNGNNEQGKSSVLDSIEMALRGKKYIPGEPLRKGEKKGTTKIDLGDLIVTRTYTEGGGGTLRVENKDGLSYSSPQKVLDKLFASVSFDPLEFVRMKIPEQMKVIQDLAGVDFETMNGQRKLLYENRTDNNREVKRYEALVNAYTGPEDIQGECPSTQAILDELDKANSLNTERASIEREFREAKVKDEELAQDIIKLKETLRLAEEARQENNAVGKALLEKLTAHGPEIDITPIREKLSNVEASQEAWKGSQQQKENLLKLKELSRISNQLTSKIEAIDKAKKDALEAARLPVDGLELREEGVYLNDLPFDQASGAVKIKTSIALGIRMNPELKVLIIHDGSLLDDSSLATIKSMAEEHDAQVWIERVGKNDASSVIIEDGMVENQKEGGVI